LNPYSSQRMKRKKSEPTHTSSGQQLYHIIPVIVSSYWTSHNLVHCRVSPLNLKSFQHNHTKVKVIQYYNTNLCLSIIVTNLVSILQFRYTYHHHLLLKSYYRWDVNISSFIISASQLLYSTILTSWTIYAVIVHNLFYLDRLQLQTNKSHP
jgi:hypothetical protein